MKLVFTILARIGLILTILPPILFLADSISLSTAQWIMVLGTILWLGLAPFIQKFHEQAKP